jgi:TPR repeat protein
MTARTAFPDAFRSLSAAVLTLTLAASLQADLGEDPAALRRACDAKQDEACVRLAWKHAKGEGVLADLSMAARLYRQACDRMYASACTVLNTLTERAPEAAQAVRDYDAACESGRGEDCLRLGHVLGSGSKRGADAFQHACESGASQGCFWTGQLYEKGETVPKDLARAASLYQKACEGGDPDTCANWAGLYQGEGLTDDLPRAAAILDLGCKDDSAISCFNLASLHRSGHGVAKDPARAVALLAESCRLGFERGCDPAALMPRPTPQPTPEPTPLSPQVAEFQDRCARGDGDACVALGVAAIRGLGGVPRDLSRASELFGESCLRGHGPACEAFLNLRKALAGAPWDLRRVSEYYLGRLHETGRGVTRDAKLALQWYQEACQGGEPRGCEAATRVGGRTR